MVSAIASFVSHHCRGIATMFKDGRMLTLAPKHIASTSFEFVLNKCNSPLGSEFENAACGFTLEPATRGTKCMLAQRRFVKIDHVVTNVVVRSSFRVIVVGGTDWRALFGGVLRGVASARRGESKALKLATLSRKSTEEGRPQDRPL